MSPDCDINIVILAAGQSSRFGGVKMLANIDGKSILQRSIDEFSQVAGTELSVILGAHAEKIEKSVIFYRAQKVYNSHWQCGISTSIKCAIANAGSHISAVVFVAADQVLVKKEHLIEMISAWRESPDNIVAAEYRNCVGIPGIFPRRYWPSLDNLSGDTGARKIIAIADKVVRYPLPYAAVDVDTREDLLHLL